MTPQSDQLSDHLSNHLSTHLSTHFPMHHQFNTSEELQGAITNYNSLTSLKIYISHSVLIESRLKINKLPKNKIKNYFLTLKFCYVTISCEFGQGVDSTARLRISNTKKTNCGFCIKIKAQKKLIITHVTDHSPHILATLRSEPLSDELVQEIKNSKQLKAKSNHVSSVF